MSKRSYDTVVGLQCKEYPYLLQHVYDPNTFCVAKHYQENAKAKPSVLGESDFRLTVESWKIVTRINYDEVQPEWSPPESYLTEAAECIADRAASRDVETERSMKATVDAFNAMYGKDLTEEEGWQFMVLLKMSRAKGGEYRRDDYVDAAAYAAFAGEAAEKERSDETVRTSD